MPLFIKGFGLSFILLVTLLMVSNTIICSINNGIILGAEQDRSQIQFSHHSGFYDGKFELALTTSEPGSNIIYTLDGSKPDPGNTGGKKYLVKPGYEEEFEHRVLETFVYEHPIEITDKSSEDNQVSTITNSYRNFAPPLINVDKATVVRAAVLVNDTVGEIFTNIYFIGEHMQTYLDLPVLCLVVEEDDLWGYEKGIYVPGINFNPDNSRYSGNHFRRGERWERPVFVKYFDRSGSVEFFQDMGIRTHGGTSRIYSNRSFRLYARSEYGKSTLRYPFFENSQNDVHKRLKLRTAGQDLKHTFFRDALMSKLMIEREPVCEDYHPVNLFINGEYWGIINIRERFDKHYVEQNFGIDRDSVEILETWRQTNDNYQLFRDYVGSADPEDQEYSRFVNDMINIQSLLDLRIAEIFFGRWDKHWETWRVKNDPDSKWQWVLWDFDVGMGLPNAWGPEWSHHGKVDANYLKPFLTDYYTELSNYEFSLIMQNSKIRNMFINSFAGMMNSNLSEENILNEIDIFKKRIEHAIPKHVERWLAVEGIPSVEHWYESIEILENFAKNRHKHIYRHIKEYFDIEGLTEINIDVSNQYKGYVKVNTLDLKSSTPGISEYPFPWQGKYFRDIPLEVVAVAAPGYEFTHWEGDLNSTSSTITLVNDEDIYLNAHFKRTGKPVLMYYWLFDTSLPNDTPLEKLEAYYSITDNAEIEFVSCLAGYPYQDNHPNWRKASMERRNKPTPINYRPEGKHDKNYQDTDMRALQVRQPFSNNDNHNKLIFHLPTCGFSDIVFRFAAMDEGAADNLVIDYSVDSESNNWITSGLAENVFGLGDEYNYYEIDFSDISGVNNNPDFKVRIRFDGEDLSVDEGNRVTFNNISLDGIALEAYTIKSWAGDNGSIYPIGNIPEYQGSNKDFLIEPNDDHEIAEVFVDGVDVTENLNIMDNGLAIYRFNNISKNHTIDVNFYIHSDRIKEHRHNVIVYPNPAADHVTISALKKITRIDIVSIEGRILSSYTPKSSKSHTMNTGNIDNGIYIIVVYTKNGVVSKKIQVIR